MKKHHFTFVLAILFLTGLFVLWWAGNSGRTPDESDAVLPGLGATRVADIHRVEVERPKEQGGAKPGGAKERIVLERRDEGSWQLLEPIDAAADPSMAEALARNLKGLRKSADAGTIRDPPGAFGLTPADATTVRVFGRDRNDPLATLDVGRSIRDQLYVRPGGAGGIEVVDPKLLGMLDVPTVEWRDKALFHMPSFRVGSVAVRGEGRDLAIERDEGRWRIVRPIRAPADDDKVEGTVAELTSLKVAGKEDGFVADDVKDRDAARYGLDRPTMTIELKPAAGPGKAQTIVVGKPDPTRPELSYARVGGQDDVVLIDAGKIRDLGLDPDALRSRKVADLDLSRVEFVRVEAFGRTFDLSRTATGWEQVRPTREAADMASVRRLLNQVANAQASAFLDPSKVTDAGLDPPAMTIRVWQAGPRAKPAHGLNDPPKEAPTFALQVGRHDALRKTVYARVEGDKSILALPDTFVESLPRGPLAFRDRKVLSIGEARVHRLKIHRAGTTYELAAPVEPGQSTHWRMLAPVKAPADEEAVTKMVMLLSNLHAEDFVSDQGGDGKGFGLHAPTVVVTWTTPAPATAKATASGAASKGGAPPATESGTLLIGSKVPKSDHWYASIEGSPLVFTLAPAAVEPFVDSEFHTHRVLSFPPGGVRRLVLRWPGRTLSVHPREGPGGEGAVWVPDAGADASGFDLSRLGALVETMAKLSTPRFLQYQGAFPPDLGLGLDEPGMTIEVHLGDARDPRVLRLGRSTPEQTIATTATGDSGPVFLLTGPAWNDLIRSGSRGVAPPTDTPAPAPGEGKPPRGETPPA